MVTAVDKQLEKFYARRTKLRLAIYCTLISFLLALSTLGSGFSLSSLISFLLILPLPLYFAMQSIKLYRKNRTRMVPLSGMISGLNSKFSLGEFLTQPSFAFRLSLILFFLISFTMAARLH